MSIKIPWEGTAEEFWLLRYGHHYYNTDISLSPSYINARRHRPEAGEHCFPDPPSWISSLFPRKVMLSISQHSSFWKKWKPCKNTSFTMLCGWHCWGIVWPLMPGNAAVLAYVGECLAVWEENKKNSLELPISLYNCFPKAVEENVISAEFTCKWKTTR